MSDETLSTQRKNKRRYRITIRNWERYQPEMSSGKQRHWVAISAHIFHDPEFMSLDLCERVAWVGLLCHACIKGPSFDLSPSFARVLWGLYRTPNFKLLEEQGFIDLYTDKTDKTDKTNIHTRSATPKNNAEYEERLTELQSVYPKRDGSQNWIRAMRATNARLREGHTWQAMIDGARRYAKWCDKTGRTGTDKVKAASTFFGTGKHFTELHALPITSGERAQNRNAEAVAKGLELASPDHGFNGEAS